MPRNDFPQGTLALYMGERNGDTLPKALGRPQRYSIHDTWQTNV